MRNYYINNMEKLTLKIAERQKSGLILEYIKKLADYEKRSDEVIATLRSPAMVAQNRNVPIESLSCRSPTS